MTQSDPKLGVTLYSFTPEFHAHKLTLEGLIAKVAQLDLGPGIEIVGYQSIKGFPDITDEFAEWFKSLIAQHRLEPSCLDANVDVGLRSDRALTDDELVASLQAQIRAARKLGFPVARVQYIASPNVMERLVPTAEREDVKLGIEIHAPNSVNHPIIAQLRERFDRIASPYLGFIPDFGSTTNGIPHVFLDGYRRRGVPDNVLRLVSDTWQEARLTGEDLFEARTRLRDQVKSMGGTDYALSLAWHAFEYFGNQSPATWAEIMPQVVHVHAKFFEIADGIEPSVPYTDLLTVFRDNGYQGFFSSEYEGWQWDEDPAGLADGFSMVRAHHELMKRILQQQVAA